MTKKPSDHVDRIVAQWRRERPDRDVAPLGLLGRLFRVAQLAETRVSSSAGLIPTTVAARSFR